MVPHNEVRFGKEHNSPLMVFKGKKGVGDMPDRNSFLTVSEPNVIVTVLKKAEDGSGLILRCYETDGKDTDVSIELMKKIKSAEHTNIIEQDGKKIAIENGELKFKIGAHAIETFKLELQ
jgi:alpha-mannosidase